MKLHLIKTLIAVIFVLAAIDSPGQKTAKRPLARNVNMPTKSQICPSLSGDGNYMIFMSNYANSGNFELKDTHRTGSDSWEDPEFIENLTKTGNDQMGSYCLSYDGQQMVFGSYRGIGIGNFDIWFSERQGKYWSQPENPGKPLNTPSNEGSPCLSPDGQTLYFMRCSKMDATSKSGCSIYYAEKKGTRWGEGKPLPAHINTGHSTTPRIMADNETLIFASERPGGKGGLDLYMTRNTNGQWSEPVALDFINTPNNDEFISVPARGDIIYYTDEYKDLLHLYKAVIPEALRPKKVMMITGKVNIPANGSYENIIVRAYDITSGEAVYTSKVNERDGSFFLTLSEGRKYDFSIFPLDGQLTYYADIFDLKYMEHPQWNRTDVELLNLQPGTTIHLPNIQFERYSSTLDQQKSEIAFKRLIALMQKNKDLNLEIGVYMDTVFTDSIPSPSLTEVRYDTSFFELEKQVFTANNTGQAGFSNDSIREYESDGQKLAMNHTDSTISDPNEDHKRMSTADSLSINGWQLKEEIGDKSIYYKVNATYHNNRTEKQAQAVVDHLVNKGAPAYRLKAKGYGDNWRVDRAKHERNYWVEVKVLR